MKEKLLKINGVANKFVNSDLYIALISVLVFAGWYFSVWIPMLCVIAVLGVIPLFLGRSTKCVLVPLTMFTFTVSTNRHQLKPEYAYLFLLVALVIAAMIFSLVRYKRDFSVLHPAKIKGFHAALFALLVPFALGGLFSPYENGLAVFVGFAMILLMAIIYTFLALTTDEDFKAELPAYMLKILFAVGVIIALQMVIYFVKLKSVDEIIWAIRYKAIDVGWAGPNNIAPMLSITIPATLYLCIKKTKLAPVYTFIAVAEFVLLFTTGCRGAILFTTVAFPAMLLYVAIKTENKLSFCITFCVLFGAIIVVLLYFGPTVVEVLSFMLNKGFNNSYRTELYELAIQTFKKWPVFGSGWDYKPDGKTPDIYVPYRYHSTFFQIMAALGVVGLIFFAIFYFWRYRTFAATRKDPACVALFMGTLLFDLYGMIDTNFFGPTFFLIMMLMTFVVEVNAEGKHALAFGGRNPVAGAKALYCDVKRKISEKKKGGNKAESPAANNSAEEENSAEDKGEGDNNN